MRIFQLAGGVQLSEAALDVGLVQLRKAAEKAAPWQVLPFGERFAVEHRNGSRLRGPSGRSRTFGNEKAAQKAADAANKGAE